MQKQLCLLVLIISLLLGSCSESAISTASSHEVTTTLTLEKLTEVIVTTVPDVTETRSPVPEIPTLSSEDARSRLSNLLANNGMCKLPCFWGIDPGKSLYQEAVEILAPLANLSQFTHFENNIGAIDPDYVEGEFMIHANVRFLVDSKSNIVNQISFAARTLKKTDNGFADILDSPFFNKKLDYYLLPNILTEYGDPTTVMLSTMAKLPSSGVPGGFKILLLYPEKGILVNYTMQMQPSGEDIMGCPSNSHVEFELYPPGDADSFFDLLRPSGWTQIIQNTYKPLDEAASLSQEEFFRTFSQPTDECILTPADLWPVPD